MPCNGHVNTNVYVTREMGMLYINTKVPTSGGLGRVPQPASPPRVRTYKIPGRAGWENKSSDEDAIVAKTLVVGALDGLSNGHPLEATKTERRMGRGVECASSRNAFGERSERGRRLPDGQMVPRTFRTATLGTRSANVPNGPP